MVARQQVQPAPPPAANTACSATEIKTTNTRAEDARTTTLPWVEQARTALDRLHSIWIDHKRDILDGNLTLSGEAVCAFDSNFNIHQRDPEYGVRQIWVAKRLKSLAAKMANPVAYACQPATDPHCAATDPNADTAAYVRGRQPPIHFCPAFRNVLFVNGQQATLIHEFAHFIPGVLDAGGYALPSADAMTCGTGYKFSAASDVLANTADALAGFVMHMGQNPGASAVVR